MRSVLYGSGLHSRQIFGVWFGAKCEWGEEKKGEQQRKGFLVLDSETQSDAFHRSFGQTLTNLVVHSFPGIRFALDFPLLFASFSVSNSHNNTRITVNFTDNCVFFPHGFWVILFLVVRFTFPAAKNVVFFFFLILNNFVFFNLNDECGVCLEVSLRIACWNTTLVFMVNV